ncbi:calmodulin-like [Littorina saxatilis]|uniref:calmodulin-like n=1 Tax=Littorina saxatilis TaxID=31220 RepID=UPI0038B66B9F
MSQGGSPKKRARLTDKEEEAQRDVWKEVFRIFDRDSNGHVSATEVGMLLRGLDMNPTERDIEDIILKIDKNGTGQIEWEEFVDFMHHLKKSTNQEQMEDMLRAFKLFDYNNDDHIDAAELRRVVTSMGDKLTIEEANQMISVADMDKDGRINYKEFVRFIFAPCL